MAYTPRGPRDMDMVRVWQLASAICHLSGWIFAQDLAPRLGAFQGPPCLTHFPNDLRLCNFATKLQPAALPAGLPFCWQPSNQWPAIKYKCESSDNCTRLDSWCDPPMASGSLIHMEIRGRPPFKKRSSSIAKPKTQNPKPSHELTY